MIAKDQRQLTLIYSEDSSIGKQTIGYLEASTDKILTINLNKTKVPDTQWVEISEKLNKPMSQLLDASELDLETKEFGIQDWITILQKNPELLKTPIAINGTTIKQIETPTAILEFFDVDSAGLEKRFHNEPATTSKTTQEDSFK